MKMSVKKEKIDNMEEFVELFFASYSMKKANENGDLYISKCFKNICKNVFNIFGYEFKELLDKNENFKIDEFIYLLNNSTLKKYWRDEYKFDIKKDEIHTKVDTSKIEDKLNKYDDSTKVLMNMIVDIVVRIENAIELYFKEEFDENIKKYIYLNS